MEVHVLADVGEEGGSAGRLRYVGGLISEEGGFFAFKGEAGCCV